jgi:peptide chain release factor subunit 1
MLRIRPVRASLRGRPSSPGEPRLAIEGRPRRDALTGSRLRVIMRTIDTPTRGRLPQPGEGTRRKGMISQNDLRQLQQYPSGPDSFILSLYVNVDQSNAANLNRGFETRVEGLFRQAVENQNSNDGHRQRFDIECRRVRQFLTRYVPKGKALVVFSDSRQDFWWQHDLQVELPTGARWSPQPWVRPLLEVIEEHDRLCVVLVDKHRARILSTDAAGIEQQAEILSEAPNKNAMTGSDHTWSQTQLDRDHVKHVQWHAKHVADELASTIERMKLSRIVIGGPVEAISIFTATLPKRIQQMVIGSISAPVDASNDRVITELKAVQVKAENEDESKIADAMITAAMKGDRAVLGVSDTLHAIQQGRVYKMVIARDFRVAGKECSSCHVLVSDGVGEKCVFCGENLEAAPDLINRASRRVLDMGGKVQLISGEAAAKLAEAGVGAVLRF